MLKPPDTTTLRQFSNQYDTIIQSGLPASRSGLPLDYNPFLPYNDEK